MISQTKQSILNQGKINAAGFADTTETAYHFNFLPGFLTVSKKFEKITTSLQCTLALKNLIIYDLSWTRMCMHIKSQLLVGTMQGLKTKLSLEILFKFLLNKNAVWSITNGWIIWCWSDVFLLNHFLNWLRCPCWCLYKQNQHEETDLFSHDRELIVFNSR